jgi:hypothetical protein
LRSSKRPNGRSESQDSEFSGGSSIFTNHDDDDAGTALGQSCDANDSTAMTREHNQGIGLGILDGHRINDVEALSDVQAHAQGPKLLTLGPNNMVVFGQGGLSDSSVLAFNVVSGAPETEQLAQQASLYNIHPELAVRERPVRSHWRHSKQSALDIDSSMFKQGIIGRSPLAKSPGNIVKEPAPHTTIPDALQPSLPSTAIIDLENGKHRALAKNNRGFLQVEKEP